MFVCSMFWNLVEVVLYLNLTWTLLELCLSWSSGSGVLSVSVLFYGLVWRTFSSRASGLVNFGWTACARFVVGSLTLRKSTFAELEGTCKGRAIWCNYVVIKEYQEYTSAFLTKAVQSSATRSLGWLPRVQKTTPAQKLLEPVKFRSQGSKLKNIWETDLNTLFQFVGWVCSEDPNLRGLGFPRSQARGADFLVAFGGLVPIPIESGHQGPYPEDRPLVPVPLT